MNNKERKLYDRLEKARDAEEAALQDFRIALDELKAAQPVLVYCVCCKTNLAVDGEFCRNCAKFHVRGTLLPGPIFPVKIEPKPELIV